MHQAPSKRDNRARALLVGVDRYENFDASLSLRGSRNDVVLLVWYCLHELGLRAENIRVLTTPLLTRAELDLREVQHGIDLDAGKGPSVQLGGATAREVEQGLTWLLQESQQAGGAALFAFSGHGAWSSAEGPLLCLADTKPDFTGGVLSLKRLGQMVADFDAKDRLVALLDCCHVAPPPGDPRLMGSGLPHQGTPADVLGHADLFNVSNRVLLAARPARQSFQVRLGGMWHGAFTFALMTSAERWKAGREASHGAYKHVLKRAKSTLKALGVPEKPNMMVPEARRREIRNQPFFGVKAGATSKCPDASDQGNQLDGGYRYAFMSQIPGQPALDLSVIVAVGATTTQNTLGTNAAWPPTGTSNVGYECWYLNTNNVQSLNTTNQRITVTKTTLSGAQSIAVMATSTSTSGFAGSAGALDTSQPYIQSAEATGWSTSAPTIRGTPVYFKGTSSQGNVMWMAWDLSSGILTQVIWYAYTATAPTTVDPTLFSPYSLQTTAPPSGYFQASSENA